MWNQWHEQVRNRQQTKQMTKKKTEKSQKAKTLAGITE